MGRKTLMQQGAFLLRSCCEPKGSKHFTSCFKTSHVKFQPAINFNGHYKLIKPWKIAFLNIELTVLAFSGLSQDYKVVLISLHCVFMQSFTMDSQLNTPSYRGFKQRWVLPQRIKKHGVFALTCYGGHQLHFSSFLNTKQWQDSCTAMFLFSPWLSKLGK